MLLVVLLMLVLVVLLVLLVLFVLVLLLLLLLLLLLMLLLLLLLLRAGPSAPPSAPASAPASVRPPAQEGKPPKKISNMVQGLYTIAKEEGWQVLFKGLGPACAEKVPSTAIGYFI